jgi:hypothetical protein
MTDSNLEETPCPNSDDKLHCRCWYDGDACCSCRAPAMTNAQRAEQGMEPEPKPDDQIVRFEITLSYPEDADQEVIRSDQLVTLVADHIREDGGTVVGIQATA